MRSRSLLFSLALLVLCQAACSRQPTLSVTVTGISPQVRSLAVLAARINEDGSASSPLDPLTPYDLPMAIGQTTFVLRLPSDLSSKLSLSIAGFAQPGGSGCLLSTSTVMYTVMPGSLDDNISTGLVDLGPGADASCDGPVRFLSASPLLLHAAGGDRIIARGWGFLPDSHIVLNGVPLATAYKSGEQLEATAPPASVIGAVPVQVEVASQLHGGVGNLRYIVDATQFSQLPPTSMVAGVQDAHVADLDGDKRPDLAFLPSDNTDDQLTIALQQAPLAFTVRKVTVTTGLVGLVAVDIDKDGDIDLVTASNDDQELEVLKNDGKGKFTVVRTALSFGPSALICADINGDGALDVVLLDDSGSSVYWLANDGKGAFPDESDITLMTTNQPTQLTSVDYDLDGKTDVVVDNVDDPSSTYQAVVFFNEEDALPMDDSMVRSLTFSDAPIKPFLNADIDGDGKPDLLLAVNAEAIHIFASAGSASRKEIKVVPPCEVGWMGTGDLDGDGLLDLAVGCAGAARVEFLRQSQRGVFATTAQAKAVVLPAGATSPLLDAQLVDLDGDGRPELLTGDGQNTYVYHNVSQ